MYPTVMILAAVVLVFLIPDISHCRSLPKSDSFVGEAENCSPSNATCSSLAAVSSSPELEVPSIPQHASKVKSYSRFSKADSQPDLSNGEELVKNRDVTSSSTRMEGNKPITLHSKEVPADLCTGSGNCRRKVFGTRVERKKRNTEVEKVHQGQLTAGDLIAKNNDELPDELNRMLVELDIVKTCDVERIRNDPPVNCLETHQRKRAAVRGSLKWPSARVPYDFQPSLSEAVKHAVRGAMDVWESYTCIRFVPRLANDTNFVFIVPHQACYSFIGMQVGEQKLSIGETDDSYCREEPALLHELGHAIGFLHEQSRPDRDQYVEIKFENIKEGKEAQFKKYSRESVDDLQVPYDVNSIMHYPETAYSKNSEPTIVSLHNVTIGRRFRLSPSDILQANRLYNCPGTAQPNATHGGGATHGNFTFLIQSKKDPSVCLASSPYRVPNAFTYTHQALYPVILLPCDANSKMQRWQWTKEGSLVHTATFLCLTMYLEDSERILFLGTCKTWHPTQLWSCKNHLIEQLDMNRCITAPLPVGHIGTGEAASWRVHTDFSQKGPLTDSTGRGGTSVGHLPDEIEEILRKLKIDIPSTEPIPNEIHMENRETAAKTTGVSSYVTFKTCDKGLETQKWNVLGYHSPTGEDVPDGGTICSAKTDEVHNYHSCYIENMELLSLISYWTNGWALCTRVGFYVNGFSHTYNIRNNNDPDAGLISGLRCCSGDTAPPVVPHGPDYEECKDYKWWPNTSDEILSGGWFTCPRGYFLKGILLSSLQFFREDHIIHKARCCKSKEAPKHYMYCYKTDMSTLTDTGMHSCHKEFLVTEMHRHSCNSRGRMCEEEITCCLQV